MVLPGVSPSTTQFTSGGPTGATFGGAPFGRVSTNEVGPSVPDAPRYLVSGRAALRTPTTVEELTNQGVLLIWNAPADSGWRHQSMGYRYRAHASTASDWTELLSTDTAGMRVTRTSDTRTVYH